MQDNLIKQKGKSVSSGTKSDARNMYASLLLAGKNLSLYPEGHSLCMSAIRRCHVKLDEYTRQYGDFRIEIERERVLCGGDDVHTGALEEGTLPFTLFRDGIRWLEFSEGVTLEEVQQILSIINRYAVLSAEPEGDIVTDFWEARFCHTQYEASDLFFGLSPEETATVSTFDAGSSQGMRELTDMQAQTGNPSIDPARLVLTNAEQDALAQMIQDEETAPASGHLNMLLDSLLQYEDESDASVILEVFSKELAGFLSSRQYENALIIVEGLRHAVESGRLRAPRADWLIEEFFMRISDADFLGPLEEDWNNLTVPQAIILGRMFPKLHPRAVDTLTLLLLTHRPTQFEQIVEDGIIALAQKDHSPLWRLISQSEDKKVARLIPVLYRLGGDVATEYLMRLTRHSSVPVRRLAVKALVNGRLIQTEELFKLLEDSDEAVRRMILKQLGRARDPGVEALLLSYLKSIKSGADAAQHIIECYRALGKCGSEQSVPFLRGVLMRRKWLPGARRYADRYGAALALVALKIPESRQVIDDAARSLFPGLRSVVREARDRDLVKVKGGR
ncbi:MAG: HEAT repeat domain-containing protein [Smithellaceae bacterium]